MLRGARLYMSADVDGDGADEDGVFDLSAGINIEPRIRTGDLISQTGSQAGSFLDIATGEEGGRAGFNLDAGGGAATVDIQFIAFEGSDGQWGDGSTDDAADASGEDVWRQMSVFFQYLNVGTYDSNSPAILEWGEFSESGVYAPLQVTFEEPSMSFSADEQTSAVNGTVTLIATRSLDSVVSQNLQNK